MSYRETYNNPYGTNDNAQYNPYNQQYQNNQQTSPYNDNSYKMSQPGMVEGSPDNDYYSQSQMPQTGNNANHLMKQYTPSTSEKLRMAGNNIMR